MIPNIQTINNFTVSSESANNIAGVFSPLLKQSIIAQLALPILSILISLFAVIVAISSYRLAKHSFANEVLKLFFDISSSLKRNKNAGIPNYQKERLCNYFSFVCYWLKRGTIKKEDIEPLTEVMKTKSLIDYANQYNQTKGSKYFDWYIEWYNRNKK